MNPSTAQARVIVDELVRCGVRRFVLCPGSRNAPLSFALHDAELAGRISLHVRIDERSAAFLALGLCKGSGEPAAVVCTSGTAVANLHPAVLEARHADEPLVVLTADRPPELLGTGANQTTVQHGIFGELVPTVDFPLAEHRAGLNAVWRGTICRALAGRGPVHVNLPLREPLVPDGSAEWPDSLSGRPHGAAWTTLAAPGPRALPGAPPVPGPGARTLVLFGDAPAETGAEAAALAASHGWPVLVEPPGYVPPDVIRFGTLILNSVDALPDELRPDAVLVVGRVTLSRGVQRLLAAAPEVVLIADPAGYADPGHRARSVVPSVASLADSAVDSAVDVTADFPVDADWLAAWRSADARASRAVDAALADEPWPNGWQVARAVVDAGVPLFLGSSNPVRDVDLVGGRPPGTRFLANRGLAGIDGSVSTAIGAALVHSGQSCALLGDLTFLHDANGLLIGEGELRPDLAIVVLNDGGGGIFSLLEQGSAEHVPSFERIFGTPQRVDLASLCAGYRVPHVLADSPEALANALNPAEGLRVIEVPASRNDLRPRHARLRAAVADTVTRSAS